MEPNGRDIEDWFCSGTPSRGVSSQLWRFPERRWCWLTGQLAQALGSEREGVQATTRQEMETSSSWPPRPSPSAGLSLEARLGVDTRLWAKVLFTALYSLIFALGTAGNALSVHVVLKARAGRPGRLRYHVLSLALSALLLLLVSVPMELYNFVWFHYPWVFGDLGCRGYYFVRELCAYATVLSVASLSAERCLAVCQPLRARRLLTPRRTRRLLSLVWVASLGLALPMAVIMGQKHEVERTNGEPDPASRVCTVLVSRATLQVFIQVREWEVGHSGRGNLLPKVSL